MEKETKMYEAGYLFIPTLSEEALSDEVNKIRNLVEKNGGLITIEEKPKNRRLAYAIKRPRVGNFEAAYFGWVKFFVNPEAVKEIKDDLSKNSNILRSLVISTTEEAVNQKPARRIVKKEENAEDKKEESIKPEEVDKKLEELLGE